MPKFAANLSMMFQEYGFLDRFQAARDAGFDAVEFLFPYAFPAAEIAERAASAAVEIVLFNLPPGNWEQGDRGTACLGDRTNEFRSSVAEALVYARELRVPRVHMMAGLGNRQTNAAAAQYRDSLRFAADVFGAASVDVLIEPLNGRDMPGYFLNDFGYAADLISALDRPNVRLQYDIYHRQILHGDVTRSLAELMPIIGHIQTASVPLRQEPGTGELNDGLVFETLDQLGYSGHVGCEYRPKAGTVEGLSWMQNMPGAR